MVFLNGEGERTPVALGIFAKEPRPGRVKTRLTPPLTTQEATDLYEASLRETVQAMAALPCDLVLFYAGSEAYFRSAFPGVRLLPQQGGDLGERMAKALAGMLAEGYPAAALIGSDSPDLPPTLVQEALSALEEREAVVIPSEDGGYVLVGESVHHPQLFRDTPWSTEQVLLLTRERARQMEISLGEVGSWEDMDEIASLQRLIRRSPQSATALLAKEFLQGSSS